MAEFEGKIIVFFGSEQRVLYGYHFDKSVTNYGFRAGWQLFKENPDSQVPEFSTKLGVYKENCGLDNVVMSWGHDEYMYQVHLLSAFGPTLVTPSVQSWR